MFHLFFLLLALIIIFCFELLPFTAQTFDYLILALSIPFDDGSQNRYRFFLGLFFLRSAFAKNSIDSVRIDFYFGK